jgi:hypothetical protein
VILLRIDLEIDDRMLDAYEWVEGGKPCEWLIPAELLNAHRRIEIFA